MGRHKINRIKGQGDTPRQAYEGLYEMLKYAECLNTVQLKNGKWVVGMTVMNPTPKEYEEWVKFTKELYDK